MKLFGNSKNAKHISSAKHHKRQNNTVPPAENIAEEKPKKKGKALRIVAIVLVLLLLAGAGGYAFLKGYIRPPDVNPPSPPVDPVDPVDPGPDDPVVPDDPDDPVEPDDPSPVGRYEGKYTFLILGKDKVSNSTDTIMVGTFDAKAYTLNVVSIPRDTMVNVSWSTKRANTLYSSDDIERARKGFGDLLGYAIDFYAVVDLNAFVKLVDAIGGVWYDVPDVEGGGRGMNYDDPAQNLSIHLKPGNQLLDGGDAIGVVRYRKGYASQDIGRIDTQQDFLMAVAKQVLENKSEIGITEIISIFLEDVDTDLDYGECAWFAKELLKMDMENISFHTLPGKYDDSVGGKSYVTIYVDQWLEMINTYLNPFDTDIKESNLNVLTRDPDTRKIYSTSGKYAGNSSWGN